ncbi:MAG TPA: MFS transporter, partial [Aestuariivirga sp.]|nr:MFS transporter [Aestuariivirga sp.]
MVKSWQKASMLAQPTGVWSSAGVAAKPRINPWIVVWLCFATLSIVMSARQSVSIMTDEWANTLGWSKTFISSGQSTALIMVALFAPVAGNLADRFGARIMLVAGLLTITAGLVVFAAVPSAGLYILGYGLAGGIGFATANMHLISTAVAKIFSEKRGLATGIANSGATAGQFITVPLLTIALTWFSWRWSIMAVAAACA